jgi:hypothetical protein
MWRLVRNKKMPSERAGQAASEKSCARARGAWKRDGRGAAHWSGAPGAHMARAPGRRRGGPADGSTSTGRPSGPRGGETGAASATARAGLLCTGASRLVAGVTPAEPPPLVEPVLRAEGDARPAASRAEISGAAVGSDVQKPSWVYTLPWWWMTSAAVMPGMRGDPFAGRVNCGCAIGEALRGKTGGERFVVREAGGSHARKKLRGAPG